MRAGTGLEFALEKMAKANKNTTKFMVYDELLPYSTTWNIVACIREEISLIAYSMCECFSFIMRCSSHKDYCIVFM